MYNAHWTHSSHYFEFVRLTMRRGGNPLPFAERGYTVVGLDLSQTHIRQAEEFFAGRGYPCRFSCRDFCGMDAPADKERYDVILVHDAIEHVPQALKERFMQNVRSFRYTCGIAFSGFPAWQMPFGGHQQICLHRFSKISWIHLMPRRVCRSLLQWRGEAKTMSGNR